LAVTSISSSPNIWNPSILQSIKHPILHRWEWGSFVATHGRQEDWKRHGGWHLTAWDRCAPQQMSPASRSPSRVLWGKLIWFSLLSPLLAPRLWSPWSSWLMWSCVVFCLRNSHLWKLFLYLLTAVFLWVIIILVVLLLH
jgi:hypothetical protein